jgi:hypothetical protein
MNTNIRVFHSGFAAAKHPEKMKMYNPNQDEFLSPFNQIFHPAGPGWSNPTPAPG